MAWVAKVSRLWTHKAALISLASPYFDLTQNGIKVQVICPGFVDSEATAINDFEMPDLISANTAANEIIQGMQGHNFGKFSKGLYPQDGINGFT